MSKGNYVANSVFIPAPEKADVPMDSEVDSIADWKHIHAETHMLRLRIGIALQSIHHHFIFSYILLIYFLSFFWFYFPPFSARVYLTGNRID